MIDQVNIERAYETRFLGVTLAHETWGLESWAESGSFWTETHDMGLITHSLLWVEPSPEPPVEAAVPAIDPVSQMTRERNESSPDVLGN